MIALGYLKDAFGIKGALKVKMFSPLTDLRNYSRFYVYRNEQEVLGQFELRKSSVLPKSVISFHGLQDRDQALKLKGCFFGILKEDLPKLSADEHYYCELLGLKVTNLKGEVLGKVFGFIDNMEKPVLRIGSSAEEVLIPFVSDFIISVSNTGILVDWETSWCK